MVLVRAHRARNRLCLGQRSVEYNRAGMQSRRWLAAGQRSIRFWCKACKAKDCLWPGQRLVRYNRGGPLIHMLLSGPNIIADVVYI